MFEKYLKISHSSKLFGGAENIFSLRLILNPYTHTTYKIDGVNNVSKLGSFNCDMNFKLFSQSILFCCSEYSQSDSIYTKQNPKIWQFV